MYRARICFHWRVIWRGKAHRPRRWHGGWRVHWTLHWGDRRLLVHLGVGRILVIGLATRVGNIDRLLRRWLLCHLAHLRALLASFFEPDDQRQQHDQACRD